MKNPIRIGRLRHRIEIQKRDVFYDDLGQVREAYLPLRSVAAAVRYFAGSQSLARQSVPDASLIVTIRKIDGLTTHDRLVWRGQVLHIGAMQEPDSDHPGRWLDLYCSEERNGPAAESDTESSD